MKFSHVFKLSSLALATLVALPAAAQQWSFRDVSLNAFGWSDTTKSNTSRDPIGRKANFNYLELEGGLGDKWGDLYGFFDIENPTNKPAESNSTKDRRYAWKAVAHFNLVQMGSMPLQLYTHIYDFTDNGFNDQNRVLGLSTVFNSGGLTFNPFLGMHQESKSFAGTASNGGMLGWTLMYRFKMAGENMMLSQWHETEFGRKEQFLYMQAKDGTKGTGGKTGQNGAVSLWWNINKSFTLGTSYRYALNKLGSATYQDGLILTARYNF